MPIQEKDDDTGVEDLDLDLDTEDEDEDDEDEIEVDDEDESEEDDGPRKPAGRKNAGGTGRDEDKTPEQLKTELDATRSKLSKSRAQQTRWKNKALAAGKPGSKTDDPTPADKRAVKEVVRQGGSDKDARDKGEDRGLSREDVMEMISEAREAEAKKAADHYKPVAVRSEAKDLLKDAGYKFGQPEERDKRLERAMKLMDLGNIELDDDGTVLGLEDEIDKLQEDWPELFTGDGEQEPTETKPKPARRRINGRAGRAARPSSHTLGTSEGQLAYLQGHGQS